MPGMSGGVGALSMAWISAEAALPFGWQLMGVTRDPRCPTNGLPLQWVPLQPTDLETGKGDQPDKALRRLADVLRERRGPTTGGDK